MEQPELAVIIPVRDRAGLVGSAIRSVARSAKAGGVAVEIVVVDDGSVDGSAQAAETAGEGLPVRVRLTVLRQVNAGPSAARNAGVAASEAPAIAFLDSDDVWSAGAARACLDALAAHPDAALAFLPVREIPPDAAPPGRVGAGLGILRHPGFLRAVSAHPRHTFASANLLMRRQIFERLDGFAPELRCSEDSDLFLRADGMGPCLVLTGAGLVGRQVGHDDALTASPPALAAGFRGMIRRERGGVYPKGRGGDPARVRFLAGAAVYTIRGAFAHGAPGLGYRVLLRHLPLILRGGQGRWIARLALTPVLSLLRPRSYSFRIRPKKGPAATASPVATSRRSPGCAAR